MASSNITYAVTTQNQQRAMSSINGMLTNNNNANADGGLNVAHMQRRQEERLRLQKELDHVLEELELAAVLRQPLADYGVESCADLLLLDEDKERCNDFFSKLAQFHGLDGLLPFKPMQWKSLLTMAKEKKEMSVSRCPNSFICPITQGA
jgi:hypothetical protein